MSIFWGAHRALVSLEDYVADNPDAEISRDRSGQYRATRTNTRVPEEWDPNLSRRVEMIEDRENDLKNDIADVRLEIARTQQTIAEDVTERLKSTILDVQKDAIEQTVNAKVEEVTLKKIEDMVHSTQRQEIKDEIDSALRTASPLSQQEPDDIAKKYFYTAIKRKYGIPEDDNDTRIYKVDELWGKLSMPNLTGMREIVAEAYLDLNLPEPPISGKNAEEILKQLANEVSAKQPSITEHVVAKDNIGNNAVETPANQKFRSDRVMKRPTMVQRQLPFSKELPPAKPSASASGVTVAF